MTLNSKQKLLCQLPTAELFPNETGKQQKSDKNAFGVVALELQRGPHVVLRLKPPHILHRCGAVCLFF